MMLYLFKLIFRRYSCSYRHFPVELTRIGRNDFGVEMAGYIDRNITLPDTCRAKYNYQEIFH